MAFPSKIKRVRAYLHDLIRRQCVVDLAIDYCYGSLENTAKIMSKEFNKEILALEKELAILEKREKYWDKKLKNKRSK